MTAGQSPTTTCGRTVWGSLRLRLALRALRLFAASGLRRFLRLLLAHQHALLRLFLVRLDGRRQAAARERGEQFLRAFKRLIRRHVLPDLDRSALQVLELLSLRDGRLAPLVRLRWKLRGAGLGIGDPVAQARVIAEHLVTLVVTLVDHRLEEIAEAVGVPAGAGVELEAERVGLRLVLAREAHADELPREHGGAGAHAGVFHAL